MPSSAGKKKFRVRAARGLPAGAPASFPLDAPAEDAPIRPGSGPPEAARLFGALGVVVLCPIVKRQQTIALLVLGPRSGGRAYRAEEDGFLRSVAACAATPIENGLIYDELRQVFFLNSMTASQIYTLSLHDALPI